MPPVATLDRVTPRRPERLPVHRIAVAALVVGAALVLVGCGSASESAPASAPTETSDATGDQVAPVAAGDVAPRAGEGPATEVVILGMIHGGHRRSRAYGVDRIQALIRAIDPDVVLCEIPPDRLAVALREHRETGRVHERRVRVFPEYTDALFPLHAELGLAIVPCAAWTAEMAADRREALGGWRQTRPGEIAESEAAQDAAERLIAAEGAEDDPWFIHTDRYDEIVRAGMEPYDRLFNDDLGAGGWTAINTAHWDLIAAALEERRGRGQRVLVMFGAWHKYWFRDRLRDRAECIELDVRPFLDAIAGGNGPPGANDPTRDAGP